MLCDCRADEDATNDDRSGNEKCLAERLFVSHQKSKNQKACREEGRKYSYPIHHEAPLLSGIKKGPNDRVDVSRRFHSIPTCRDRPNYLTQHPESSRLPSNPDRSGLSAAMYKTNAVPIWIMDVHFAIAPALIGRLEVNDDTHGLQFFMEHIHIFDA